MFQSDDVVMLSYGETIYLCDIQMSAFCVTLNPGSLYFVEVVMFTVFFLISNINIMSIICFVIVNIISINVTTIIVLVIAIVTIT